MVGVISFIVVKFMMFCLSYTSYKHMVYFVNKHQCIDLLLFTINLT